MTGRTIKRIVVYESENSPPKYVNRLRQSHIEAIPFKDIYDQMVDYIHRREGVKEDNPVMRFMHFLHEYKKLQPIGHESANKAPEATR